MLREIRELRKRVAAKPPEVDPQQAHLSLLNLLEAEVTKRLAFEQAMLDYLDNAASTPFAAADRLRLFLASDRIDELEV